MNRCLVGYTGFVGQALLQQTSFDHLYNSKNIGEIRGKAFDLLVCAGAPAVKWLANQRPEEDLANLNGLMDHLSQVRVRKFVLISTVDVYQTPRGVDEETPIDPEAVDPYGRHRFYLERFARDRFDTVVVRLPGLFGQGLKKNFIYDLLKNPGALHLTHSDSFFQFYNIERLWADLERVLAAEISLVNLATEPLQAREVAARCFGVEFTNVPPKEPVYYDMQTRYGAIFGSSTRYAYNQEQVVAELRDLVSRLREQT